MVHTVIIVNPASGAGGRRAAAPRHAIARAAAGRLGVRADVAVTERPGHAGELASRARRSGADLVLVWGGDGTINEVASALAYSETPLGIVPGGTGNGLARGLAIPLDPDAAFAAAVNGRERRIDAGEMAGRLFVNVAGVGLDAQVARAFNRLARRWLPAYVWASLVVGLRYDPATYRVTSRGDGADAEATPVFGEAPAMLVAVANGVQYGSGARIAPAASFDDGRLNLVAIEPRSALRAIVESRRLFDGTIGRVRGVTMREVRDVTVSSDRPMLAHVDGEPFQAEASVRIRVRERALLVRVPQQA